MMKLLRDLIRCFRFEIALLLMPLYFAALLISPNFGQVRLGLVFVVVHLFLYPADNLLHSYGTFKNPETKELIFKSVLITSIIILLQFFALRYASGINFWFISFSVLYIACSWISYKLTHVSSKFSVLFSSLYRSALIVLLIYVGLNDYQPENLLNIRVLGLAIFSTFFYIVFMKQADQFSSLLIQGEKKKLVLFALILIAGFLFYLWNFFGIELMSAFIISMIPAFLLYYFWLMFFINASQKVKKRLMLLYYFLISVGLNGFFIYAFLKHSNVLQVFS